MGIPKKIPPYAWLLLLGPLGFGPVLAEGKHAMGFIPEAPEKYAALPKMPRYRDFIPVQADLSASFPKPGDQGDQGSCVAWASAYAARSYHEAVSEGGNPDSPDKIFSPAFVYNQVKAGGCDGGSSIADALTLMKQTGVATLADFPYTDHECSRLPNNQMAAQAARFRIDDWKTVADFRNPSSLSGLITAGHPIIFGMQVPHSFLDWKGQQIYDDLSDGTEGGHAMVLVGYDDRKQAFKLINSWGKGWGDNGFGWISYRALAKHIEQAYIMQPEPPTPPKPQPVIQPPAPVSPPEPKINPAPLTNLPGKLAELTQSAVCADLKGEISAPGQVTLSGFVGHAEDLARIENELATLGVNVRQQAKLHPWPQCEAMLTFQEVLAKPQGLSLSVADGKPLLNGGDGLTIAVTTPDYPSYLYLTYLQANGDAVHLVQPQGQFPKPLPPNSHLVLGNGEAGQAKFTITPPFGAEMIVAIATASPLFDQELPNSQIERDYLSQFRRAFLAKPKPGAADRLVAAAISTLVTQANP